MSERLKQLDGNYRFLILDKDGKLTIVSSSERDDLSHQVMTEAMNLGIGEVRGGYVVVWDEGRKMAYCGGAYSVREASEDDFNKAKKIGVEVFDPSQ